MKNKLPFITLFFTLLIASSCHKDPTGNPITVEATSNVEIEQFRIYEDCGPGPNGIPLSHHWLANIEEESPGNYAYQIEKGYENTCFFIAGTIPAVADTVGKTVVSIKAFYTEEGNVCGFFDVELDRPHAGNSWAIRYEFQPSTFFE
jgi:hypothetical protein